RGHGKTENYHAMLAGTVVAPGHAMALPMMPEFIAPQDGAERQDESMQNCGGLVRARLRRASQKGESGAKAGAVGQVCSGAAAARRGDGNQPPTILHALS